MTPCILYTSQIFGGVHSMIQRVSGLTYSLNKDRNGLAPHDNCMTQSIEMAPATP